MSTRAELNSAALAEALSHIDAISRDVPIEATLNELQLVVERLTFSGLDQNEVQNDASTMAEIDLYFRDEVSEGMVNFIRWMAEGNRLHALSGKDGRIFLDYAIDAYRAVVEVNVLTAIPLEPEHKAALTTKLRQVHPEPARILFRSVPTVIAGFVIEIGQHVIDRSLRNHVATVVPRGSKVRGLAPKEPVGGNRG